MNPQFVTLPRDGCGMQFDGVVVMPRGAIDVIALVRSCRQRRFGVSDLVLQWLALKVAHFQARGFPRRKTGRARFSVVGCANERFRVVGLFLTLRKYDRDGLAIPMNEVGLHHWQLIAARRLGCRHEKRRWLQSQCVTVRHYQNHAFGGFRRARVKGRDSAPCNGAIGERGIKQTVHWELGGKTGAALHLERAIDARDRRANQAVLAINNRVWMAAWHYRVRRDLDRLFHHRLGGIFDDAHDSISISSANTVVMVRFANSTLNALS